MFVGLLSASFADQIWQLFLSQGVCFGVGMGFLYIPATAVLPQWFSTRRSLAVGIASSGAGLGGVAYNLIAGVAARKLGLGWTYRLLALCSLGVNGICAALIKDRNKMVKPKQNYLDWREFGHVEVILVIVWGFLSELGYIVLLYSLPHYATTIGLTQSQGSVVGAVFNVGLGVFRPLVGYLSDHCKSISHKLVSSKQWWYNFTNFSSGSTQHRHDHDCVVWDLLPSSLGAGAKLRPPHGFCIARRLRVRDILGHGRGSHSRSGRPPKAANGFRCHLHFPRGAHDVRGTDRTGACGCIGLSLVSDLRWLYVHSGGEQCVAFEVLEDGGTRREGAG